ncbi:MAG: PBP1A family penicillin-binding protein [Ruminococcaceae bacterium]|nr:PBP1A family penicillin-binding protein [Oscillospiraceae bacterium]
MGNSTKKSTLKNKKSVKNITIVAIKLFIICVAIFFVWMTTGVDFEFIDAVKDMSLKLNTTVYYTDSEGNTSEFEHIVSSENRIWVEIDKIPQEMQNAIVAIEDERFFKHKGVDVKRTLGAVWGELTGGSTYGGSTLTQQLVKNITGDREHSRGRKVREIFRAIEVEKKLTKSEILELYLNTIYLGQGCYGVQTASNKYFGKNVQELSLAESAAIVGITQYPSLYDPLVNPDKNEEKRKTILDKMLELGYITDIEHDEAYDAELEFNDNAIGQVNISNSYFVEKLISDVIKDLIEKEGYNESLAKQLVYNGGLKIYSTVDKKVQDAMDDVFENEDNFPKTSGSEKPQAAMVIIDPYTGEVKGLYGGRGKKTESLVLNRATDSYRQPGSSIKPLSVYGPAIDRGAVTQYTVIEDEPLNINGWQPKNYDGNFTGSMTVKTAITKSQNIPAINILMKIGVDKSYEYLTQKMHFTSLTSNDKNYAALSLGGMSKGVSVYEMCAAYSSFVNNGVYNKPKTYTKVTDSKGKVILESTDSSNVVFSENAAYTMRKLLKNAVDYGTGGGAQISGMETGGKTGTTDSNNDRWFAGITPYYCGVVWFGYDVPKPILGVSGNPALTMWKKVMAKTHEGLSSKSFDKPSGASATALCSQSNKLATSQCEAYYEYFTKGTAPKVYCEPENDHHIDPEEETEENNSETDEGVSEENNGQNPIPDDNQSNSSENTPEQNSGNSQSNEQDGQNKPSENELPTVNLD